MTSSIDLERAWDLLSKLNDELEGDVGVGRR